jgi:hypothetical protein
MGFDEGVRAALGGSADLRVHEALEILHAYEEALERAERDSAGVASEGELPYPKDTIKWALLVLLAALQDAALREPLKAAYVSLAEWQDRAHFETATFDSMRLRRKMDPLQLAREFAALSTPHDRLVEAARAEQQLLIGELKRKGFW